jgi:hypothetical protein
MDRLDAMRAFVAVAEARGFAAAARRLAMSPPAVTRGVAMLEARVGARLLHRTTRVVRLTEAGDRFLGDCKRILAEIDDAESVVAGIQTERGDLAGSSRRSALARRPLVRISMHRVSRCGLMSIASTAWGLRRCRRIAHLRTFYWWSRPAQYAVVPPSPSYSRTRAAPEELRVGIRSASQGRTTYVSGADRKAAQ